VVDVYEILYKAFDLDRVSTILKVIVATWVIVLSGLLGIVAFISEFMTIE
jgi:hypothetical protein